MWGLTLPLAASQLALVAAPITDTAIAARHSDASLAAVAFGAPLALVATVVTRGWGVAAGVVAARHIGAGSRSQLAKTARSATLAGLLTGMGAITLVALFLTVTAPGRVAPELLANTTLYLLAAAGSVPLLGAAGAAQGVLAGTGDTRTTLLATLLLILVNAGAGVWLALGLDLGALGVGLAQSIAALAALILAALRARKFMVPTQSVAARGRSGRTGELGALTRIAWPESTLLFFGYANEALIFAFAASMNTRILSAYRLLDSVSALIFAVVTAVGSSVSIAVSRLSGRGQTDLVVSRVFAGFGIASLLALPLAFLVGISASTWTITIAANGPVADLAQEAATLALLSLTPLLVAIPVAGALRALGDNRYVLAASLTADYVVLVPLAWLLGPHLNLGVEGFYFAWLGYAIVFCLLVTARFGHRYRRARTRALL